MNELMVAERATHWHRLKALVLDSVSSPITRRVYNLGLDEFIAWFMLEVRPAGFTKATVTAWRVSLEARGLGPISINVRITAVRKFDRLREFGRSGWRVYRCVGSPPVPPLNIQKLECPTSSGCPIIIIEHSAEAASASN
jgi:hypothetical protein